MAGWLLCVPVVVVVVLYMREMEGREARKHPHTHTHVCSYSAVSWRVGHATPPSIIHACADTRPQTHTPCTMHRTHRHDPHLTSSLAFD